MLGREERCKNPWNGKCDNTDIELYIMHKGRTIPISRSYWTKLTDKTVEWGAH